MPNSFSNFCKWLGNGKVSFADMKLEVCPWKKSTRHKYHPQSKQRTTDSHMGKNWPPGRGRNARPQCWAARCLLAHLLCPRCPSKEITVFLWKPSQWTWTFYRSAPNSKVFKPHSWAFQEGLWASKHTLMNTFVWTIWCKFCFLQLGRLINIHRF